MLRRAPPLEAIEVFVAAAPGRSFRAVARDLALSPSAVSRRIAQLEAFLGVTLFDRGAHIPTLSEAGRRYLAMVEPAMAAIQSATTRLATPADARISIAASHSFASAWLLPRLGDLQSELGVELEVIPTRDFNVVRSGEARFAIWGGNEAPDDLIGAHLFDALVTPVTAPRLACGRRLPARDAEVADYTLLTARSPTGLWERWLALAGIHPECVRVREFATLQLTYEAAAAGLGVALGLPLVTEPGLASGRLVACTGTVRSLGESYRLYRSPQRPLSPSEQDFIDWLRGSVDQSVERFEAFAQAGTGRHAPPLAEGDTVARPNRGHNGSSTVAPGSPG